jgi:hypothetical protein
MEEVERWNGGTVEGWKGGRVERWNGGTAERRNGGTAERRNGGTAERRNVRVALGDSVVIPSAARDLLRGHRDRVRRSLDRFALSG